MTAAPEFNARTGQLWLSEEAFAALLAHTTSTAGPADTADQLRLLNSAAAVDTHGRPHDALAGSLTAICEPVRGVIELSYAGKSMRGWLGEVGGALLMPDRGDGRRLLTHFPFSVLPGALAKVVDLGPRPRPEPAAPVRYEEGVLGGVRRHWLLTAEWGEDERPGGGAAAQKVERTRETQLEVIDTEGGLWRVQLDGNGERAAWPTTPTRVWRQLVRMVLRRVP